MTVYHYEKDKISLKKKLQGRRRLYNRELISSINEIFDFVERHRDRAIRETTKEFDGAAIGELEVSPKYMDDAVKAIPDPLKSAIAEAKKNIEEVNREFLPKPLETKTIREGTVVGEKYTALTSVGLWIPSRKAPLISTALMLIGAAKAAGVRDIYVGMAPIKDGRADIATTAAAKIAGADRIFIGNGVAIIAAFSIGTDTIPEVEGIFGPGPGGIAAAMSVAFSYGKKTVLGIGPTDAAIICDGTVNAKLLAYDLANEAEHGPDSSAILVTTSKQAAIEAATHLDALINNFPDVQKRKNLQSVFSLQGYGAIICCDNLDTAIEVINEYAPEHVMIKGDSKTKEKSLLGIINAGEILIGDYTPFSAGNYAIGITAVLPTNGYARNISGVTSKDMIKTSTIGELDQNALKKLLPTIKEIGTWEGLPMHVLAAEQRLA